MYFIIRQILMKKWGTIILFICTYLRLRLYSKCECSQNDAIFFENDFLFLVPHNISCVLATCKLIAMRVVIDFKSAVYKWCIWRTESQSRFVKLLNLFSMFFQNKTLFSLSKSPKHLFCLPTIKCSCITFYAYCLSYIVQAMATK